MSYTKKGEHIKAAAEALSDLNMFAGITALCESSLFSTASYSGESQIVRLYKKTTGHVPRSI